MKEKISCRVGPRAGPKELGRGNNNGRMTFGKHKFRHVWIGEPRQLKSFRQNKVGTVNGKVNPLSLDFAMGGLWLGIAIEHNGNLGDNILHEDDKSVVAHATQEHADDSE